MDISSSYIRLPSSGVRLEIILSLAEGAKVLSELRSESGRRATTILHTLTDLEEIGIIKQIDKTYRLTPIGMIEAALLKASVNIAATLEKFQEFWLTHDISSIPESLLLQIGALRNAMLIKTEEVDLGRVHETFLELLKTSKEVKGISPIFHLDYLNIFEDLLKNEASVELILTSEIMEQVISQIDVTSLDFFIKNGRLKLFQSDHLPVGLTVTDNVLSLGLFGLDGRYDYNMDVVCLDPEGRAWGVGLFEHYKKRARIFEHPLG